MTADPHLGRKRWPELGASLTLLIPVGSCEQHGPHLPLDTDVRIATAIAERAASAVPNAVVAPALAYSSSGEHAGFPGTLSIGSDVTRSVIVELGRSADWAHRLVLVNGHGGNIESVRSAVALLQHEGRDVTDWWPSGPPGDLHAGRVETSVMLHLDPSAVGPLPEGRIAPPIEQLIADGVLPHSPTGVLGDPTNASAADGESILLRWVDDLVGLLRTGKR